jgi:hypothetical protein
MLQLHLLLHTSSNIWNAVLRLINLIDLHQLPNHPINQSTQSPNHPIIPITNHQSPITQLPNYPITPRFLYPALLFSHKYLPHPRLSELLASCESAVTPSFKRWLSNQTIISRSRLSKESRLHYLTRLLILYSGQPKDLLFALRFLTQGVPPKS